MARFLSLDWDHKQLYLVSASVKRGSVRVHKAVTWEESQSPTPATGASAGQTLRERLKAAGIAPAPLLACVGRDRLIVKDIRYPAVPEAEEPAVVRFQVVKELTDPAEEVVIDYLPAGATGAGERRAFAVVMRRELVSAYRELAKAAGLKLAGLTPRPFGSAACLNHLAGTAPLTPAPEPPGAAVAVLTIGQPWAEFCVMQGGSLLFARSLTTSAALAGEVRRNLAVYAGQASQNPVRAVYVSGAGEHAALRDRLHEMLGLPVYPLDPFAGAEQPGLPAEHRGAFAGAVGVLYAQSEAALPVNFVKPKEPKPPRDPNRNKLLIGAAAAVVLLLATFVYCQGQLSAKDEELAALQEQQSALDGQLAKLDEDAKRIKALDEWTRENINWLDELYDLTDRFPDDFTKLRLARLNCGVAGNLTGKEKYVGTMTLTTISGLDQGPVNQLQDRLVQDGHFRVGTKEQGRNNGANRIQFRQQFTQRVELEKLEPGQFVVQLPEPTSPSPGNRRRLGGQRGGNFGPQDFNGQGGGRPRGPRGPQGDGSGPPRVRGGPPGDGSGPPRVRAVPQGDGGAAPGGQPGGRRGRFGPPGTNPAPEEGRQP